jgi:hypothetical protein
VLNNIAALLLQKHTKLKRRYGVMLNRIWGGLLLLALGLGFLRGVVSGPEVVNSMADALFTSAKTGF